jgi:hypothetical protein
MKLLTKIVPTSLPFLIILLFSLQAQGATLKLTDSVKPKYGSSSRGGVSDAAPEMLLGEPKYKSTPRYIALGKGDDLDCIITCALDESGGPNTGYDTIYIDQNNNGDLTDDPAVTCEKSEKGSTRTLLVPSVPILVRYFSGDEIDIKFRLRITTSKRNEKTYWGVTCDTIQHLQGKMTIDGKDVLIGLYDVGARGRAPNASFIDFGVDTVRIDRNGNGILEEKESALLCKIFSYNDKLWAFNAATTDDITITPSKLPATKLSITLDFTKTKPKRWKAILSGNTGFTAPITLPTKVSILVPDGSYTIKAADMPFAGPTGLVWQADISTPKPIKVSGGNQALVFGGPLKLTPSYRSSSVRAGQSLRIEQTVTGIAGEQYSDIRPINRGRVAPYVKLFNKKNVILAEGKMEYG